jgi:hypothetical protein
MKMLLRTRLQGLHIRKAEYYCPQPVFPAFDIHILSAG